MTFFHFFEFLVHSFHLKTKEDYLVWRKFVEENMWKRAEEYKGKSKNKESFGRLMVIVHKGKSLNTTPGRVSDPYVIIHFNKKKKQTKMVLSDNSPLFEETIFFTNTFSTHTLSPTLLSTEVALKLEVYDKNYTLDELLGTLNLSWEQILLGADRTTFTLKRTKNPKDKSAQICLTFVYNSWNTVEWVRDYEKMFKILLFKFVDKFILSFFSFSLFFLKG